VEIRNVGRPLELVSILYLVNDTRQQFAGIQPVLLGTRELYTHRLQQGSFGHTLAAAGITGPLKVRVIVVDKTGAEWLSNRLKISLDAAVEEFKAAMAKQAEI